MRTFTSTESHRLGKALAAIMDSTDQQDAESVEAARLAVEAFGSESHTSCRAMCSDELTIEERRDDFAAHLAMLIESEPDPLRRTLLGIVMGFYSDNEAAGAL